jgi:zinc/manganese transport system substrate-binding protein
MTRGVAVVGVLVAAVVVAGVVLGVARSRVAATRGRLEVVAAENVYGSIAAQIGGRNVLVTSILSDPNADPHLFEPGTANGLAVARARVVIQNGAGYDAFMQRLEAASPNGRRIAVTVADVLGVHDPRANPHLWYDVPKLNALAGAIAAALARADPKHQRSYEAGLHRFDASLRPLRREVRRIRAAYGGEAVAYTEPVPGYLVSAAGLRSLTPESFAHAIETGTDPTPQALAQMLALLSGHRVRVLLYNTQTQSPITTRIRTAAHAAGIPIVGVSETLPPGMTFQQWQLSQAQALRRALA